MQFCCNHETMQSTWGKLQQTQINKAKIKTSQLQLLNKNTLYSGNSKSFSEHTVKNKTNAEA